MIVNHPSRESYTPRFISSRFIWLKRLTWSGIGSFGLNKVLVHIQLKNVPKKYPYLLKQRTSSDFKSLTEIIRVGTLSDSGVPGITDSMVYLEIPELFF